MTLPRPIAGRRLTAAVSLGLAVLPASGQRPDTELAKLRAEHEKGLASASRLVDDIHRLTLRQLERERAEAGDYETAGEVKARLEALERAPGTAAIVPPPLTHTLSAARALTRDGANTEGGREYVEFRRTGGKAIWELLGLEKGTYEVFLTYSVGLPRFDESTLNGTSGGPREAPKGVIAFSEVTGLSGGAATSLEKRVTTSGAWENYIRESIGRHEFRNATASVKLEAVSASEGGLLRLRQVELVKVVGGQETAAAEPGASEPARALQSLQAQYRRNMKEAAASLRSRFTGEFLKLEQELSSAGDAAAAATVTRFRERLFPAAAAAGGEDPSADPMPGMADEPEEKKP
jgi:hypothetical protein